MIELDNVSFTYNSSERESGVHNISITIPTGQVVLFCGESGCGKTTLTRIINKLIPEYYEGKMSGKVIIDDKDVTGQTIYDFNGKIGTVFQNPRSQFFNVDTTSEIAFGCENYGIEQQEILRRIGQAIGEMKIQNLMGRNLFALSGGGKQKVACASVSAMEPDIFILDEPSSNLDVATIWDLRQAIIGWKKKGKTILIAEHRLYYLMDVVDRIIILQNGQIERDIDAASFWKYDDTEVIHMGLRSRNPTVFQKNTFHKSKKGVINIYDFSFAYDKKHPLLDIPMLSIPKGSIVAVLGHNGAGKTTFGKCLCGLLKGAKGTVEMDGVSYDTKERLKISYMVMQDVNHQLFTESVLDEILLSMSGEDEELDRNNAISILDSLNLEAFSEYHPMSLSGGQKQRVAIGSAIASAKSILLFDEPTSGLDYHHMLEVADNLQQLSNMGKTVFVITHDPELIGKCCNYFVFIENGKVKWSDGWNYISKQKLSEFFVPVDRNYEAT